MPIGVRAQFCLGRQNKFSRIFNIELKSAQIFKQKDFYNYEGSVTIPYKLVEY